MNEKQNRHFPIYKQQLFSVALSLISRSTLLHGGQPVGVLSAPARPRSREGHCNALQVTKLATLVHPGVFRGTGSPPGVTV